jgi:hypothetical protein
MEKRSSTDPIIVPARGPATIPSLRFFSRRERPKKMSRPQQNDENFRVTRPLLLLLSAGWLDVAGLMAVIIHFTTVISSLARHISAACAFYYSNHYSLLMSAAES